LRALLPKALDVLEIELASAGKNRLAAAVHITKPARLAESSPSIDIADAEGIISRLVEAKCKAIEAGRYSFAPYGSDREAMRRAVLTEIEARLA
jgi:hypothetical protein